MKHQNLHKYVFSDNRSLLCSNHIFDILFSYDDYIESSGELRNPDPETDIGEVLKMIDRILPPVHDPETEQKLQQVDQQVRELEADVTNSYNKLVAEGESRLKDRINNYQNLD